MKLMDFMKGQKKHQEDEMTFKQNYRRKSVNPSKKKYCSSNFIKAQDSGSRGASQGINLLNSSAAFKTMTTSGLELSATKSRRLIGGSSQAYRRPVRPVA